MARSRPSSDDDRGRLDRTIAPDASVRRNGPVQRPALTKSAALATSPLHSMGGRDTGPSQSESGQAEPPRPGASAGDKPVCDERLRSEQAGLPPVAGDRQIAGVFAVNHRHGRITFGKCSLRPLRLCGSFRVRGRALCFSVRSVPLWFFWQDTTLRCRGSLPRRRNRRRRCSRSSDGRLRFLGLRKGPDRSRRFALISHRRLGSRDRASD